MQLSIQCVLSQYQSETTRDRLYQFSTSSIKFVCAYKMSINKRSGCVVIINYRVLGVFFPNIFHTCIMYILNVEVVWLSITILFRMYACLCRSWSPVHSNVGVSLMFVTSCSDQVLDKGVNEMHFSLWSKWSNLFKLLYWNTFKIFSFHFRFPPFCSPL